MKSMQRDLATRHTSRKLARACGPLFETMEARQMMDSSLYISSGTSHVTIDVNPSGGIRATVMGVTTDYSPGDWSDIHVSAGPYETVFVKATNVPVDIYTESGDVTLHNVHGMRDIKAFVAVRMPEADPPFHNHYHVVLDDSGDLSARTILMESINGNYVIGGMAVGNIFIAEKDHDYADGTIDFITGSSADQVNIRHVDKDSEVKLNSFGGLDTVTIGGNGVNEIHGEISVNNTPSLTHLVVDYSAGGSVGVTLDGWGGNDFIETNPSSGPTQNTIYYKATDIADVTVKQGNGIGVEVLTTEVPTKIVGATTTGTAYVAVGGYGYNYGSYMGNIMAPLTISNPSGYTSIALNDVEDLIGRAVTVNAQSITGLCPATISWVSGDIKNLEVNLPGVGGNNVSVRSSANPISISSFADTNEPADAITISNNGSVQGIAGAITIDSYDNTNILIDDSADATARNATLDVTLDEYGYEQGSLSGLASGVITFPTTAVPVNIKGGSGGNTFNVNNTPSLKQYANYLPASTINLFSGTGADTVNVKSTGFETSLNIEGQSGYDTVNVGKAGYTYNILGAVNVTNILQYTKLTVDDSADLSPRTITLDALAPHDSHPWGSITGIVPGAINYRANDMKDALTIKGGMAGNTVLVNSTPVKTVGFGVGNTIDLITGQGLDHVTVKAVSAGTTLNVNGQSGYDPVKIGDNGSVQNIFGTVNVSNTSQYEYLTIDDSADPANRIVTIGVLGAVPGNVVGSITGIAPGIINFVAADVVSPTINGGSGANTYNVIGTPTTSAAGFSGPTITLFAGSGADVVNVSGMGNGTGLQVYGQGNDDLLSVDYSGGGIPINHTITYLGGGAGQFGDSLSIKGTAATTFNATATSINRGANGNVDYSAVNTLFFNTGTYNVNGNLNSGALAAQSAATNVLFNTSQTIGKLYIDGAQTSVAPGGGKLLALKSLNILNNGLLDLSDNSMLLDYTGASQLPAIQNLISTARAGGAWTGGGLTSTSAKLANPKNTTLAAIEATEYKAIFGANATFAGQPLDDSAVIVKYTYYGDTDFNGIVDFDDYSRTDFGFNSNRSGWTNGDFDANGVVDFDDYSLMDQAFNTQTTVLARGVQSAGRANRSASVLR